MSFLICARIKAKKRKVEEKKGHGQLPNVEISPAALESPENSVIIPDTPSPTDIEPEDFRPTKASVTFAPGALINNGTSDSDIHKEKSQGDKDIMACHQDIIAKLKKENDSLRQELESSKQSQEAGAIQKEIVQLKTEIESLRSQNLALQKGLRDTGISAKVMEDREEKLRCEEQKLVSERQMVQGQIQDCYAKMRPILERETTRQEEVDDLREKLNRQNRSSRRIFELMERLMVEWKQNVLLRAEVKKLKTLVLSSSRSLNNITRGMEDRDYKVRGAIKTEVSKVVKVTYDSKREVIQYQQVINDALDSMLAIRQLQTTDACTHAGDYQLALQQIKEDHTDVAAVIGPSWRKVGRNLGFSVRELQGLMEGSVETSPENIAWRLIERWTENTEDESLLLGNFITALREAEIDTSIGPMPEDDLAVLQRLNTYLHDTIKHTRGVLPFMHGFGLLTGTMKRFIERGEGDSERVRRLLSIVPTLGEHTLPIFSEILRLGGHDNVAEQICKEQLLVRLERSDTSGKPLKFMDGHLSEETGNLREDKEDSNGNESNTFT